MGLTASAWPSAALMMVQRAVYIATRQPLPRCVGCWVTDEEQPTEHAHVCTQNAAAGLLAMCHGSTAPLRKAEQLLGLSVRSSTHEGNPSCSTGQIQHIDESCGGAGPGRSACHAGAGGAAACAAQPGAAQDCGRRAGAIEHACVVGCSLFCSHCSCTCACINRESLG